MISSGISEMSLAVRLLVRNKSELYISLLMRQCSQTVVGLETLVGLSTGLRCSLKWSLSLDLVSPMYSIVQGNDCTVPCR